ncbi:glutamine amidotransferase [Pelomonas aquatica]|uniref:Glutamine amidotransferase n=1 Tax=Pelomonas aquatica TaxID=431058 RepID=A0ABU1ZG41_9BURK|nr:class II glutamine amidotransferase [Pelomonas aquatica]MDR7299589.1 glutamine amidotransferase [Pelomonas aquatica]
MCELFALNSRLPAAANFSLRGFAARGGRTADHVDGWGVAFHDGERCEVVVEDQPAAHSDLASHYGQHPVQARNIIAHIRKATQGARAVENCHPFRREWAGRTWVFAHNGDLKDFHPKLSGAFTPAGQTDSERAFCWLMQRLEQRFGAQRPGWPELADTLTPWLHEIAGHGRFNLLLTDGHGLLAHASTKLHWLRRQPPFAHVRLRDGDLSVDLATLNGPRDRMTLIATEPLTHDEAWQAFEPGEVRVFEQGDCIYLSEGLAAPVAA